METIALFFHLHLFIHSHNRSGLKILGYLRLKIKRGCWRPWCTSMPEEAVGGPGQTPLLGSSGEGAGEWANRWRAVGDLKGSTLLQAVWGVGWWHFLTKTSFSSEDPQAMALAIPALCSEPCRQ